MELLFVALGGALLGLLARYTLPGRSTSGVVLIPAIGAAAAGVVWLALTWAGLAWDAGLIWWITLALSAATSAAAAILISRQRDRADSRRLAQLTGGRLS